MITPEFICTIYIHTTPERLWQAPTDPVFTERYWGVSFDSDWTAGSSMSVRQDGVTIADSSLGVLESEPYRRLSYTWYPFTPKCADDHGLSDEDRAHAIRERRSTVTFDIDPLGQLVTLTVVQGGFEPGSPLLESVTHGWPVILSGLKTLLETGELLPALSDAASVTP